MSQVFKEGNVLGKDKVRVHRGGNRIDGVSKDNELFYNDLPIPKRSKIDLSFDRKLSFNMGELVPVLCQECVPGDTFHIAQAHNLFLAPLVAPLFQRIDYRTYYFFVPTRLVDDGWKDFITLQNPNYVLPYFTCNQVYNSGAGYGKNSLFDYFDIPIQQSNFSGNIRHLCAHPLRAYQLIWNEFFRDEFKQTALTINKSGGAISNTEAATYNKMFIGWEKDYFTTCQTTPQVGADVSLPVGITSDGTFNFNRTGTSGSSSDYIGDLEINSSNQAIINPTNGTLGSGVKFAEYNKGLKTTGTINDLRIANHLQELRDKLKIAGARYNEAVLAEFGVVVPDYRIQRPEYIGGFASPVEIGKVMQQTPTSGSPLGSYAGSGTGSGRMDYIHFNALEHGYIIGLSVVVPRTAYDQGIPRQFMKDSWFDFYHPDFATLGDQEVKNDEIYISDNTGTQQIDNSRFGYQQRYAEYKYNQDRINGEFRDSLSFWHQSREFNTLPALNGSFVTADPSPRIFAVQNLANHIYAEIYQQIDSVRPMPVAVQPNLTNVD